MPSKAKRTYSVMRKYRGGERVMFHTGSYKKALGFYRAHPRAIAIQRYNRGVTSGRLHPDIPNRVRVGGKSYERAYHGPFTRVDAQKLARSFRRDGHGAVARKVRGRGWHLFVRIRKGRR